MGRIGALLVAGAVSAGISLVAASPAQAVAAESQPPVISLLSPGQGESFSQTWEILLYADASDSDGKIVKVQFYDGSRLLATDTASMYFTAIRPNTAKLGEHRLRAVAYDNDGLTASAEVTVTVRPPIVTSIVGDVVNGVESGCMILKPTIADGSSSTSRSGYLLIGGDQKVLVPGAHVSVTGEVMSGVMSYCMQGTPLRVISAEPV